MNFQDFLAPIQDGAYLFFDLLEFLSQNFNYLLMFLFSVAGIYWIVKLFGYEKSEVSNRQ